MRLIDADRLKAEIMGWCVVTDDLFGMGKCHEREIVLQAIEESPTISAAPVVRGEWIYAIKKGSCYDYHVTAKCSECGWDWFSADGIGNYSAVFGAFITNGDSKPEEAERFLLENARANNKLNYCPNCGAKMESEDT